jgi:hypothetical protein
MCEDIQNYFGAGWPEKGLCKVTDFRALEFQYFLQPGPEGLVSMTLNPKSRTNEYIDNTGCDPNETIDQTLPMSNKDVVEGKE